MPNATLQRGKAQAYSVLALRSNRWLLALLALLPVAFALLRVIVIAVTPASSSNATAGLEIQSGLVVPAFFIAMVFGLFAARPDDPQLRMDAEFIDQPRRRRVWFAKLFVITAAVGVFTTLSQALIGSLQVALPAASRATAGSLLSAAASFVAVTVAAACLGMVAAKLVRDALTGAFALTLAFWLIPTLAMPLLNSVGSLGLTASDFNPVQLAEKVVWRAPTAPLSFQGLAQSKLEAGQAWLAILVWLIVALLVILGVSRAPGVRRRFTSMRANSVQLNPTEHGSTGRAANSRPRALNSLRAAVYRLAVDRAVLVFITVLGLFEVYATLNAANDVHVSDVLNRQENMFFAYGPTPLIATFFFVALRRSRDLATGELGQRVIESASRVQVFLRDWLAQSLFYAVFGLVVLAVAWASAFAGNMLTAGDAQIATGMAVESSVKFVTLTAAVVAWGLAVAHRVTKPAATLVAALSITLLLPGVLVGICLALGAIEFMSQASYWLPTQVLVSQHDPGDAGLYFDAFGHTLMTPNQRMLIAGVYGLIALGVGSLAARFKALL